MPGISVAQVSHSAFLTHVKMFQSNETTPADPLNCEASMRNLSAERLASDEGDLIRTERVMPGDLTEEAAYCRAQSVLFAGRPEEAVLVRLAREFERLATAVPTPEDRVLEHGKPCA